MFTKDKKRAGDKEPAAENRRTASQDRRPVEGRHSSEEQSRRRPAEGRRASEEHPHRRPTEGRRTSEEQSRRRPAEGRRASEEQPRRRPAEGRRTSEEQSRRRPAEGRRASEEQPRRRPAEGRRASEEQPRRRPAEGRSPAEEPPRRRPAEADRRPEFKTAAKQMPPKNVSAPAENRETAASNTERQAEERVIKMQPEARKVPTTSRTVKQQREAPETRQENRKKVQKPRIRVPSAPPQGTSYHRSSPRPKKSLMDLIREKTANPYADPAEQEAAARARQAARAAQKKKLQKLAAKYNAPAIMYTKPLPFNSTRLLIQLVSVLAVAAAFVLGLSVFFKVETITVSGADTYSPYKIEEASGIKRGDYLLTFGRARACGQITAKLPYIKSVRIGIKLPNTVNIDVQEADVAYSIRSNDGDWWLITSEGKVVDQVKGSTAGGYTTVLGVQIENPIAGEDAVAMEAPPEVTDPTAAEEGEEKKEENSLLTPPVTVSATMRLKAALRILVALEENDIVGDAATVNVENLEQIELWYGQKYQVNLGTTEQLEYKIACMYDAILQMNEYQNGMLDVSFTKKKDQVVYTPFV